MTDDFGTGWYNRKENKETGRLSVISLIDDEYLCCNFYEYDKLVGSIPYYDKSFHYVRDAADNWCEGVKTHETVKKYTEKGDLFQEVLPEWL